MPKKEKKKLSLEELAAADEAKERGDLIANLTVRDRLMRRLRNIVVPVEFKDDLGVFTVKCRAMSQREQQGVIKLQGKTAGIKGAEGYGEFMDELLKFIAYPDGVCLDPELNMEFWRNGDYAVTDLFKLLTNAIRGSTRDLDKIRSFR